MKRQSTEVVKIMRGTTEVSKIYRGTSLYYDKDVHPDILLNYIANGPDSGVENKSVWYDTGVPIVNTSFLKAEIKTAANISNQSWPLGGMNNGSWAGFCIYGPYNGGGSGMYSFRVNNKTIGNGSTDFTSNQPHVITGYLDIGDVNPNSSSQYRPVLIIDGTEYRSTEYAAVPNQGMNIYLFTRNLQSGQTLAGSPTGLKIYYVKIWDNNNLIRFYIPVLHFVDGQYVACFYDKVNGNYIYNLGTDTPVYSATNDYMLDYIGNGVSVSGTGNGVKSSDAKYDSGVAISRDVNSDVAFVYGNNNTGSNQEAFIIGDRDSNSNKFGYMFSNAYLRVPGYNITSLVTSSDTKYRVSCYYNSIAGYNRRAYVNDTLYSNSNTSSAPANTANLFLFGSGTTNVWAGTQIYYAIFTNKDYTSYKSLIPVLHNGLPVYYDLNTNTYISNEGTGNPTYKIITS